MSASEGLEKARDGGAAGGALLIERRRRQHRLLYIRTSAILTRQRRDESLGDVAVRRSRRRLSRRRCLLLFQCMSRIQPRAHPSPRADLHLRHHQLRNSKSCPSLVRQKTTAPALLTHIVAPDFLTHSSIATHRIGLRRPCFRCNFLQRHG